MVNTSSSSAKNSAQKKKRRRSLLSGLAFSIPKISSDSETKIIEPSLQSNSSNLLQPQQYTDKNGKSKLVDALVKAHTADLARQKFIKYFNKDEGTTIVTSCIRKPGYIEKQGGIL